MKLPVIKTILYVHKLTVKNSKSLFREYPARLLFLKILFKFQLLQAFLLFIRNWDVRKQVSLEEWL